ncbi:4201_t:CDS:2 [Funneliformis geosporum]|uniref:12463_t:CDS:1 n=1 Tax=Funneliformis geosporum TaxID=1117311 RepID=A0A9W4WT40_9GLOM|nr:4201_t:CDS:2 [Funneliformis geosporum]CAI2176733.1 12463_t:CDS:2 [Funneliformis geosporum]
MQIVFTGPVVINVKNGETVHQRVLLIYGRAGPRNEKFQSNITVEHHATNFPSTTWPVFNSHFKCLVHLDPGSNNIKLILDKHGSKSPTTILQVNYIPLLQNPPLHLAILVAKDSKEVIDAPKEKDRSGENKLDSVIAKLRCAGYLWQAFTAEQMSRNEFGRRVFRLEEEWIEDTLSNQNPGLSQTAKVHIIRSSYTLEQILDPDIAQQNPNRKDDKKDLYSMFMDGLKEYGIPFNNQCYVAGLILDSHYDNSPDMKFIRGHAALGGGGGNIQLGIFGSHLTHAWPRHLEEVVGCFQDDTITDETILSNDAGESGTWWKCCNIGIGAFLHEVGHCLGAPHAPSGIMARGFNNLNRTFTVKEPNNPSPIKPSDENGAHWHRGGIIRFRYHPCFRSLSDPPLSIELKNLSADFWRLNEFILIKSPSGVSLIEFFVEESLRDYKEYVQYKNHQTEVRLKISEVIEKYGDNRIIKLNVVSKNQTENSLDNLRRFLKESKMTLPIYGEIIKSPYLGKLDERLTEFRVFFNKFTSNENKPVKLNRMVVKYGYYINGITFFWSDGTQLSVGKDRGNKKEFGFMGENEKITELKVNSGWYIDGFEIKTNLGRCSEWFGKHGGNDHILKLPESEMIGLYGTSDDLVNTLGLIYKLK